MLDVRLLLLLLLFFFLILMNFILLHFCIKFFYTLTYEQVGKIQKTEKKTKHIQCIHRRLTDKKNKQTNPSTFISIYMKKK